MKYAGIGSRQTPELVLEVMRALGKKLAQEGWLLRSGGADGADSAFEAGCDAGGGKKQIFLPWRGFNHNSSLLITVLPEAFDLAAALHPAWEACSPGAKKLLARNCHQILGPNLDDPVDVVYYWCPVAVDGTLRGGTSLAVNLAVSRGIATQVVTDALVV